MLLRFLYNSDNIVTIVYTEYTGNWGSGFGRGKGFLHTSCPTLNGDSFAGCKVAKYDGEQSPPFRAEVKNE